MRTTITAVTIAFAATPMAWAQEVAPPVVRQVVVIGAKGMPEKTVSQTALAVANGKPGDAATLLTVAEAVARMYRAQGFSVAQVVATELSPAGVLTLTVAEGTVRRVIIRGNTRTESGVIRRVLDVREGDIYREDDVRDARVRLARLGIFEEITVVGALESDDDKDAPKTDDTKKAIKPDDTPLPPDTPTKATPVTDDVGFVDVIVRVKERRTGNIAATVGFNEGTGLIGFVDFSEANVAGTANRAQVLWQRTSTSRFTSNGDFVPGRTRAAYLVSYDVPALNTRTTAFGAEVYNTNTVFLPFFANNQDNLRNYEVRRGAKACVGKAWGRNATVYLTARRDDVGYDPLPDNLAPPLTDVLNAEATVAAFGTTLQLDGRDDAANPRRGYLHNLTYERAGSFFGGTRNFAGLTADLRSYTALGASAQSPVLAVRIMGGAVGDNAPLSEQFFLGGYDLLRGYDLFSIRGSRMVLSSAELRVPLGPGFQGVVFTDIGNAFLPGERVEVGRLRGSGGLGLRFLTPLGPIRLDVAYGNRVQTYVSLGQSY